jgi:PilZ domain
VQVRPALVDKSHWKGLCFLMVNERRRHERYAASLKCSWSRSSQTHANRVIDISLGGCYVNTSADVLPKIGEVLELAVDLDGTPITLRARVIHVRKEIGFAVEFTDLRGAEFMALRQFLASLTTPEPYPAA